MRVATWTLGLLLLNGLWNETGAETLKANMLVRATVVSACTHLTVNPLTFGNYLQNSASAVEASSTVHVTCTKGVAFSLDVSVGNSFTNGTRQMASAPASRPGVLAYNLYTSDTYTQVWGSDAGGAQISGTGIGDQQNITVHGRIPSGQTPLPGDYSDTVAVTLTF